MGKGTWIPSAPAPDSASETRAPASITVRGWIRLWIPLALWFLLAGFLVLVFGISSQVGGWAWSALIFVAPVPLIVAPIPARRLEASVVAVILSALAGLGMYFASPPGMSRLHEEMSTLGTPATGTHVASQEHGRSCLTTCPSLVEVYDITGSQAPQVTSDYETRLGKAGFVRHVDGSTVYWQQGKVRVVLNTLPTWASQPAAPARADALFSVWLTAG